MGWPFHSAVREEIKYTRRVDPDHNPDPSFETRGIRREREGSMHKRAAWSSLSLSALQSRSSESRLPPGDTSNLFSDGLPILQGILCFVLLQHILHQKNLPRRHMATNAVWPPWPCSLGGRCSAAWCKRTIWNIRKLRFVNSVISNNYCCAVLILQKFWLQLSFWKCTSDLQ